MKPIKNILRRPTSSPTRNMLNAFFLPEDQDGFARTQGYEDAEQMIYYEDKQHTEEPTMTDREVQEMVERGAHADDIARAMGYESSQAITDTLNQMEREAEQLPPPPPVIYVHELAKMDSREVYTDSEDCPPDDFRDLAGVY